jgi:hypothetical protein
MIDEGTHPFFWNDHFEWFGDDCQLMKVHTPSSGTTINLISSDLVMIDEGTHPFFWKVHTPSSNDEGTHPFFWNDDTHPFFWWFQGTHPFFWNDDLADKTHLAVTLRLLVETTVARNGNGLATRPLYTTADGLIPSGQEPVPPNLPTFPTQAAYFTHLIERGHAGASRWSIFLGLLAMLNSIPWTMVFGGFLGFTMPLL